MAITPIDFMGHAPYDISSFGKISVLGISCEIQSQSEETFAERLSMMVEAGFEYIYFGDELFSHIRNGGNLLAIKQAVNNAGLKMRSAHFGYLYPGPGDTLEGLKSTHLHDLDTAAELGLKCVTTHYLSITGMGQPGFLTSETIARFSKNWISGVEAVFEEAMSQLGGREAFLENNNDLYRWFCDQAAQRDITVTIETATCHLTKRPSQILEHIRKIDRPNLGICLDTGHSHIMMGDVAAAVREAGSFLTETHFHDNFGEFDSHRPVGIGTINWVEVIRALRDVSFSAPVTFEVGIPYHNGFREEIELYARNWRELLYTTALEESRSAECSAAV